MVILFKRYQSTGKVFILLLCLLFGNGPLFSQEFVLADSLTSTEDTLFRELSEIVITATRMPERIIDIPYSVVRLNYSNYQFDRKVGASDMLSAVPGLFLQSRYGNHDVRFSIRGFGSRSNSGIRGIRILLDDIPESEPDGQTRIEAIDFNSIGRIEIVKGNASSLYTNAPGGVVNFINDIEFDNSSLVQFNQAGSFGLFRKGIKAAVRTNKYRFLTTYSYQNYDGYREHNNEYWHILNTVVETTPSEHTRLTILGYFVDGMIKLPGSLTKEEFEKDPYQANQRSIDRDEKRITTKGRVGIRYNATFGRKLNNDVEVTTYGTIKYFERTSREYRIINRYGLGLSGKYIHRHHIGTHTNEVMFGGDLFAQPARTEYYENINGARGDQILQLTSENITNKGLYFSNNFEILYDKMFFLLTGRYDNVKYRLDEETLPSRGGRLWFHAFTPKVALNYKILPLVALYTSFGYSFDSPANNELDSPDPVYLFNQDLKPQESQNFEMGIKGKLYQRNTKWFKRALFEATGFYIVVDNEIVPFEVLGEVYFRNAAKTHRMGTELGGLVEIWENLNLEASYTWSHFRYKTYDARIIEIDTLGNIIQTDRDFAGNIVPSVPANNLYVALSYAHPIGKHYNIFAKVSYQGISGLWVDDANTDETAPYSLLNSVLGVDMRFGNFNLMLSGGVNNIFDVIYVGFTNTNSADKRFYEAGAPRDYFVSLNLGYRF
ncbi:MAG: TonB-dependent receptor [Bacteroidia bacterium]|nr:TonB-dependent receptor [Bacteroidia bacterium]